MSKIYVVFTGLYSGRTAQCAFDNEKDAELYCAERNDFSGYSDDDFSIEELELNPCTFADDKIVFVYRCYREQVSVRYGTFIKDIDGKPIYRYVFDPDYIKKTENSAKKMKCTNEQFYIILDSPEAAKAEKIAQDKVAEIKAISEGIT